MKWKKKMERLNGQENHEAGDGDVIIEASLLREL
jgi:hypothetical protein